MTNNDWGQQLPQTLEVAHHGIQRFGQGTAQLPGIR